MEYLTLPALLDHAAETWADKPAAIEADRAVTFMGLRQQSRELAKKFIGNGFNHGDRFAIWAPNSIAWQITTLAGQLAGCVLVPLNTRYKAAEAEDIVRRSGCRALFHVGSFLDTDYAAMAKTIEVEHRVDLQAMDAWSSRAVSDAELDARIAEIKPDALMDVLYTSGTTGAPKGVMCSHEQNLRVFDTWSDGVTLSEHDQYLIVNPYFHSFGYKAGWLAALIRGATVYPVPVFEMNSVLDLVQRKKISFLPGAPTIFQSILSHDAREDFDLASLRCAVTGAAAIPVQLVKDMKHVLGFDEVYTAYGLTESTGVVSLCQSGDDFETIATTSGKPMAGIELQITLADGTQARAGEQGEIRVRGFNVMKGYLDDPEATADTITEDGWLKTGDIGLLTDRGYLRITDRIKDMYISGGFNCYPAEIENALLGHENIQDVSVVGVPDERMGEVGRAFVVSRPGSSPSGEEIITWARERLANFKVPKQVSFIDELPRNASGKVQKFLLKEDA